MDYANIALDKSQSNNQDPPSQTGTAILRPMEEYHDSSMAQYQLLGKDPIPFMMPVNDQFAGNIPS